MKTATEVSPWVQLETHDVYPLILEILHVKRVMWDCKGIRALPKPPGPPDSPQSVQISVDSVVACNQPAAF